MPYTYLDKTISTDKEGFLASREDWTVELGEFIANKEGVELTDEHWHIIRFVQDFYDKYNDGPSARILVKSLKEAYGPDIGNSIYLHKLFPDYPAKQAAKYGGLPKPRRCL